MQIHFVSKMQIHCVSIHSISYLCILALLTVEIYIILHKNGLNLSQRK